MAHEPHSHIRKTLLSLTLRKFHQTFPYFFTWISFLLFSFYSHVFVNPSKSIFTHNVSTKIGVSVLCCLWWSRDRLYFCNLYSHILQTHYQICIFYLSRVSRVERRTVKKRKCRCTRTTCIVFDQTSRCFLVCLLYWHFCWSISMFFLLFRRLYFYNFLQINFAPICEYGGRKSKVTAHTHTQLV